MPRDALEPGPLDAQGNPAFPDLPRRADGTPDWDRLGGEHPMPARSRTTGRRLVIDPRPSVPHPVTGEPTRPE